MAAPLILVLLLGVVLWLPSLPSAQGKELNVLCVAGEDCVLPCEFLSDGKGARIMWYKKKVVVSCTRYGDTSFVVGHNSPAEMYVGRTSQYVDQVLEGNATLLLKNVTPADQGKYICVTMTAPSTDESGVVTLTVIAPVRHVDIEFLDYSVVCRSDGIFPPPTVEWSTEPPTDTWKTKTRNVTEDKRFGFHGIESALLLGRHPAGDPTHNVTFICNVSNRVSNETAFLRHRETISVVPGGNVEIPCSLPPEFPQNFNLSWRFSRSDTIVTVNVTDSRSVVKVWDPWKTHVFASLSATRSLHVHRVNKDMSGTYTCEVRTAQGFYVTWTEVTTEDQKETMYIIIITILSIILYIALSAQIWKKFGRKDLCQKLPKQSSTDTGTTDFSSEMEDKTT